MKSFPGTEQAISAHHSAGCYTVNKSLWKLLSMCALNSCQLRLPLVPRQGMGVPQSQNAPSKAGDVKGAGAGKHQPHLLR